MLSHHVIQSTIKNKTFQEMGKQESKFQIQSMKIKSETTAGTANCTKLLTPSMKILCCTDTQSCKQLQYPPPQSTKTRFPSYPLNNLNIVKCYKVFHLDDEIQSQNTWTAYREREFVYPMKTSLINITIHISRIICPSAPSQYKNCA